MRPSPRSKGNCDERVHNDTSDSGIVIGRQIYTVEWLRAIAATLVVLFHTSQGVEFRTGILTSRWTDFGASGVDIFFVISGFIMTMTTHDRDFRIKDFLLKRVVRLMPIYWALTLLKAISLLTVPSLVLFSIFSVPNVITSLLLIPYDTPGRGVVPLIIVAWTLEIEIFFYFVFAVCRGLSPRLWPVYVGLVFCALNLLYLLDLKSYVLQFYARPILFEFLFGIVIGRAAIAGRLPSTLWCVLLILVGGAAFAAIPIGSESTRFLTWGLPAAVIVTGTVALERRYSLWRWPPMVLIGNSSYSLYLTHTLAVPFLMLPLKYIHLGIVGSYLYLIPAMVAQVAIGYCAYRLVERPITRTVQQGYKRIARARAPLPST